MPPFDAITPVLLDPAAKNPGDTPLTICPASKGGPVQDRSAQIIIPELLSFHETLPHLDRWSNQPSFFEKLNMDAHVNDSAYDALWHDHREILQSLLQTVKAQGLSVILLIEGWDAGGKSGLIRRMFDGSDKKQVNIAHTIAPTKKQLRHHHLKRFRDQLPKPGKVLVLDRSWYGRLLVERVDHITPQGPLFQSIDEINTFEHAQTLNGTIVLKFWLHVSQVEQRHRLSKRALDPKKRHKFKPSDIRNYHQRVMYENAANDMLAMTSTSHAPWHIVAADHKPFARLCVITQTIKALERAIADHLSIQNAEQMGATT